MKRPYVTINCAMSADGKIALPNRTQVRISSDEDIARMYQLRHECDAVLVGIETILSDNPKLTVKERYVKNPKQPLRVVLDSNCRIPRDALVLNKTAPTLLITTKGCIQPFLEDHIEVYTCKATNDGFIDLPSALAFLHQRGIQKLLVEGGGTVIWNFINNRLFDDLFIYIGPCIIGGKDAPTPADGLGIQHEDEILHLKVITVKPLGSGILTHYRLVL